MSRRPVPIISILRPKTRERFESKLIADGDCLVFTGTKNKNGYGFVNINYGSKAKRFSVLAHRLAWVLANEQEVPLDKIICHRCHNPSCCNPKHLYAGTHRENSADMISAGRSATGSRGGLYGVKGTKHPRALYDQTTRDQVIQMLRQDCHMGNLSQRLGINRQTIARWWHEYEAACGCEHVVKIKLKR